MSEEEEDCCHCLSKRCTCLSKKCPCLSEWCTCFGKWCFYILSCISCQYVPDASTIQGNISKTGCSICSIIYLAICSVILGSILNCFPLVLFVMDWIGCPIHYYNICYTLEFHSSNPDSAEVPEILLRSDDDGKKC